MAVVQNQQVTAAASAQELQDLRQLAAVGMPDSYAGELPVCYVGLLPDMTATDDDLRSLAEAEISERPAWPRHIHIVDTIPMTAVGKIFKPTLRQDAAKRTVQTVLDERDQAGEIEVTAGGPVVCEWP